jgi:hypothetical protein
MWVRISAQIGPGTVINGFGSTNGAQINHNYTARGTDSKVVSRLFSVRSLKLISETHPRVQPNIVSWGFDRGGEEVGCHADLEADRGRHPESLRCNLGAEALKFAR